MNKQQIQIFINSLNYDLETLCILIDCERLKETIPIVCKILSDIRSFKEQIKMTDESLGNCLPAHWEQEDARLKIEAFFKNGVTVSDQELKSIKYELFLENLRSSTYAGLKKLKRNIKSPLQKRLEIYLPFLTIVIFISFTNIKNFITKDWGMRGDFYEGTNFEKYISTGYKKTIDFDDYLSMNSRLPPENFSAHWQGYLIVPKNGSYTFSVFGDDGVRLFIDNNLIIDKWYDHHELFAQNIFLTQGFHKLKVDHFNHLHETVLKLYWTIPNGKKEIISEKYLRLIMPISK